MASDADFVKFLEDSIPVEGSLVFKKMFGEYGFYWKGKIVGLVCDDQLFVKPTKAGRDYLESIGTVIEAPPYPGAKNYFLIEDNLDNPAWVSHLIELSWPELPAPKKRKVKRATRKG